MAVERAGQAVAAAGAAAAAGNPPLRTKYPEEGWQIATPLRVLTRLVLASSLKILSTLARRIVRGSGYRQFAGRTEQLTLAGNAYKIHAKRALSREQMGSGIWEPRYEAGTSKTLVFDFPG